MKFKVLNGKYRPSGKNAPIYKKGDVFTSDLPLDTKFPGMFTRLGDDEQPVASAPSGEGDAAASPAETPAPRRKFSRAAQSLAPASKRVLEVVPAKGGKWNVVDEDGNVVNDKPLTKPAALELVEQG